jgi:Fe-S oxidoreductase
MQVPCRTLQALIEGLNREGINTVLLPGCIVFSSRPAKVAYHSPCSLDMQLKSPEIWRSVVTKASKKS